MGTKYFQELMFLHFKEEDTMISKRAYEEF